MEVLIHGSRYEGPRTFHCWRCNCWFRANEDEWHYEQRQLRNGVTKESYTVNIPVARCPECDYVVDKKTTEQF